MPGRGRPRETPEFLYRITMSRDKDSEVRFVSGRGGLARFLQRYSKKRRILSIKEYSFVREVKPNGVAE